MLLEILSKCCAWQKSFSVFVVFNVITYLTCCQTIYEHLMTIMTFTKFVISFPVVLCLINTDQGKSDESLLTPSNTKGFFTYWQKQKTVPFYLIVMLFPLSSLKSPTFFTKFNALGKYFEI